MDKSYVDNLYKSLIKKDRIALSQAITLIESQNNDHKNYAMDLLDACYKHSGNARRIGITGAPGVGKSTFIEALGLMLIEKGHKVAVLTIDPTSPMNQGSILGDKSRMELLSHHEDAYVRSSPTRNTLGGTTDRTRETITLCEAAQYDFIIIETVGVGQSETEIMNMTDLLLLLTLPGGGDELQGIKRGIVEVADMIIVNKIDKFEKAVVKESINSFNFAIHLNPTQINGWQRKVYSCSSTTKDGLNIILSDINKYFNDLDANGQLNVKRTHQNEIWLKKKIEQEVLLRINHEIKNQINMEEIKANISEKKWSIPKAAQEVVRKILG